MREITVTASAAAYLQKSLQAKEKVIGIRLGLKPTGCSGWSYTMDFATELKQDDKVFHTAGVQLIVDLESFKALQGMEIDCVRNDLSEHLIFNNPNVKNACGCGESFSLEK